MRTLVLPAGLWGSEQKFPGEPTQPLMESAHLALVELGTEHHDRLALFTGDDLPPAPSLPSRSAGQQQLAEMVDRFGQQGAMVGGSQESRSVPLRIQSIQVLFRRGASIEDRGQLLRLHTELSQALAHPLARCVG